MAEPQETHQDQARSAAKPFEVRVDGARHGAFRDVRDAIAAAQIVKRETPGAVVGVRDATTGQVVLEIEP